MGLEQERLSLGLHLLTLWKKNLLGKQGNRTDVTQVRAGDEFGQVLVEEEMKVGQKTQALNHFWKTTAAHHRHLTQCSLNV